MLIEHEAVAFFRLRQILEGAVRIGDFERNADVIGGKFSCRFKGCQRLLMIALTPPEKREGDQRRDMAGLAG